MSTIRLSGIEACVFDAYGTLFDINAAAQHCAQDLGPTWQPLADTWRLKQLQYTWLRALMGRHIEFWQVTTDALDFALATHQVADAAIRQRLLDLYWQLDAYPEVKQTLATLKAAGLKTAILSNGSPDMLRAAAENAGIADILDGIFSVEEVGVFKPHPSVYGLPARHFDLATNRMSFQSSNCWDAHAAKAFGFNVVWINRFGQAPERIPESPDAEITTLGDLPEIVGAA